MCKVINCIYLFTG